VKIRRLSAFLGLFFTSLLCHATTKVTVATYYNYAPWHIENEPARGLTAELARHLTRLSAGKYEFVAEYIPRKRVDMIIEKGQRQLVVAWVSPRFFGDSDMTRYFWTHPLLEDESLIISPSHAPLRYTGPDSLVGKRFSASFGHKYADIDPLVEAGKVKRYDAPNLPEATLKLIARRGVDFGIIDRSTLVSMANDRFLKLDQLYIATTPRIPRYTRHILIPKKNPELADFVKKATEHLNKDASWRAVLRKAGVFCPHPGSGPVLIECG
jgi:polar amino acid transport system substrate-binding protein